MTNLVAERSRELIEPLGLFDEAAIDIDETARQREGIHVVRVHDVEMPGEIGTRRRRGDALSQLLDVPDDPWVVEQRKLRVDLRRILLAHRDLLLVGDGAGYGAEAKC